MLAVADRIAATAKQPALIVVKSTVPIGTCDAVQARADADKKPGVPLEVVSNPEFLKEGAAVQDFFRPDRIVLGARSEARARRFARLYAPLQLSGERVVVTDPRSSELTKYAANAMLAMRVSFMNELARLATRRAPTCTPSGSAWAATRGSASASSMRAPVTAARAFPRTCRPSFTWADAHGVPMRMAEATHLANEEQAQFLAQLVESAVGHAAGQDDCALGPRLQARDRRRPRGARRIKLAAALLAKGARVVGHDPEAGRSFAKAMASHGARVEVVDRDYDALDGAHALVLLTEWRSYRAPNFREIRTAARRGRGRPPIVSTRERVAPRRACSRGLALPGHRRTDLDARSDRASKTATADRAGVVARILVTGGVGFIGYHVTRTLLARG